MATSPRQPSHPDIVKVITQPGDFTSYAISLQDFAPGTLLARLTWPTLTFSQHAYSTVQVGPHAHDNIELNCDFLFINHSCDPNLEFHVVNPSLSSPESKQDENNNNNNPSQPSSSSSPPSSPPSSSTSSPPSPHPPSSSASSPPHPITIDILVAPRLDSNGNQIGLRAGETLTFFYPSTEWDMAQPFRCLCGAETRCRGEVQGARYLERKVLEGYFVNEHVWRLKGLQERAEGEVKEKEKEKEG